MPAPDALVDANGTPRINAKGEPLTIKDVVAEMRASDTFGRAFEGSGASGGGTPPKTQSGGMPGGTFTIRREAAQDTAQYRAAREAAAKAGQPLTIVD